MSNCKDILKQIEENSRYSKGRFGNYSRLYNYVWPHTIKIPKTQSINLITFDLTESDYFKNERFDFSSLVKSFSEILDTDLDISKNILYEQMIYAKEFNAFDVDVFIHKICKENLIMINGEKIIFQNIKN